MMNSTVHRGPDHSAFIEIDDHTAIAHNRLSIIDPTNDSHQPYIVQNRYYLSFNGEIYNYKKLNTLLIEQGINIKGNSDTETLIHLLILKKEKAIELLEGIYAFVFYDSITKTGLAVRDQFGVKPLFYYYKNSDFIVSSSCQTISEITGAKVKIKSIASCLQYKYPKNTIYKGVRNLDPDYILSFNERNVSLIPKHKATLPTKPLKSLLQHSVADNLVADTPIGLMLSGGVDSQTIAHQIHHLGHRNIQCYYVRCDSDTAEESSLKQLCTAFEFKFKTIDLPSDFDSKLSEYISKLDSPIGDIGGFLSFLVAEEAKKDGVKVLLSGIGADEMFGGYNRHRAIIKHDLLRWIPLKPLLKQFPKLHKLGCGLQFNKTETWNNYISLRFDYIVKKKIDCSINNLQDALRHEQRNYLRKQLLPITDQAGMAHGVEIRVPYLHSSFYNYLKGKPDAYFYKTGSKWELRSTFNINPAEKKGFGIAVLNTPLIQETLELLANKNHLFYNFISYESVQTVISNHKREGRRYQLELWNLIILSNWFKTRGIS